MLNLRGKLVLGNHRPPGSKPRAKGRNILVLPGSAFAQERLVCRQSIRQLLTVSSCSSSQVLFAHCPPHIVITCAREQVGNMAVAYE